VGAAFVAFYNTWPRSSRGREKGREKGRGKGASRRKGKKIVGQVGIQRRLFIAFRGESTPGTGWKREGERERRGEGREKRESV